MNKNIMYSLMNKLSSKGCSLLYYQAYSTDSCYIKVDFGLCYTIRISDHKGIEKYKYRYNLMTDIKESYKEEDRNYYCLDEMN